MLESVCGETSALVTRSVLADVENDANGTVGIVAAASRRTAPEAVQETKGTDGVRQLVIAAPAPD